MALLDLLQCVQYLQMQEIYHPPLSASRLKFLQLHRPKELVPFLALAPELLYERFARRAYTAYPRRAGEQSSGKNVIFSARQGRTRNLQAGRDAGEYGAALRERAVTR